MSDLSASNRFAIRVVYLVVGMGLGAMLMDSVAAGDSTAIGITAVFVLVLVVNSAYHCYEPSLLPGRRARLDLVGVLAPLDRVDAADLGNTGAGIALVAIGGLVAIAARGPERWDVVALVGFVAITLLAVSLRLRAEGSQ